VRLVEHVCWCDECGQRARIAFWSLAQIGLIVTYGIFAVESWRRLSFDAATSVEMPGAETKLPRPRDIERVLAAALAPVEVRR
jgi:hypothetical protein